MKTIVTEGKVVEVTDDGWAKIEAVLLADKPKQKFEPITLCCLTVGISDIKDCPIKITSTNGGKGYCDHGMKDERIIELYETGEAKLFIKNLQSVIDYVEANSVIDYVEANK